MAPPTPRMLPDSAGQVMDFRTAPISFQIHHSRTLADPRAFRAFLAICPIWSTAHDSARNSIFHHSKRRVLPHRPQDDKSSFERSEEHTSELQSRLHLVCRLLLEKK